MSVLRHTEQSIFLCYNVCNFYKKEARKFFITTYSLQHLNYRRHWKQPSTCLKKEKKAFQNELRPRENLFQISKKKVNFTTAVLIPCRVCSPFSPQMNPFDM